MKEYSILFKNKSFVFLWTSQVLSQLTIQIINFLLIVRIFEATESTIATSFLWVSYALPAIIIGPIASASVDLINRKKVLIYTNLLQSLVIFIYSFVHGNSLFLLYGAVLSYSFLNQFYVPAELAALPSIIGKEKLPLANGLFLITQQVSLVIGLGIAGTMGKYLGFGNSMIFCAILLFLAFVSVTKLPDMKATMTLPKKLEQAISEIFKQIIAGYKYMTSQRGVLYSFVLLLGMQVSLAIIAINAPVIAIGLMGIDINDAGMVIVAPAGLGALVAAYYIPKVLRKKERKITVIEKSMLFLVLNIMMVTFLVPSVENIFRLPIIILLSVLLGFSFLGIILPAQTFLQEKTKSNMRGRVFGNYGFLLTIVTVIPVLVSGTITEIFGIKMLLFILGAIFLATLLYIRRRGEYIIELIKHG